MTSECAIPTPPNLEKCMAALKTKKTLAHRAVTVQDLPESLKYSPSNYTYSEDMEDIGVGLITVNFEREKDSRDKLRSDLASEIASGTVPGLLERAFSASPTDAKLLVNVRIVVSDGNCMGRMCCGEFGFGHAKLVMQWCLADSHTVYMGERMYARDSAAIGCEDLAGDAGPECVRRMAYNMTKKMIHNIRMQVLSNGK